MKIEIGDKVRGKIPYETLPAFYYFFQELGFHVHMDTENQKIQLRSALFGKKILISPDRDVKFHTYRRDQLEWQVLEHIQKALAACGANVILLKENEVIERADLHFSLSLFELPVIKEPVLELTHNSKSNNKKFFDLFQYECKRTGTKFKCNEIVRNENAPYIKVHIMYPFHSDDNYWDDIGEKYTMAITTGILASFQGNSPLSVFSLVPMEIITTMFGSYGNIGGDLIKTNKEEARSPEKKEIVLNRQAMHKREEAEVFFDYHFLIDEQGDPNKIKIIGNLHIKNTGTEILRNPVICLCTTPSENIKITGQIMPSNVAQTMGIMGDSGTKGWRYMNDDWFEETEKGETWICPIQSINIEPLQTETLSNFQISFLNSEGPNNIRVEAFVFFKEQELEFSSSNKISLLVTKK